VGVSRSLVVAVDGGGSKSDAAVVVCGTGVNGAAVRADGTVARIPALGRCSGDWGGGAELAEEVLWLAARAEDGRGDATALREALLAWTGLGSVAEVAVAVHRGSLSSAAWRDRMPEVFALAASGDAAAARLVTRQGRELGLLAGALLSRVELAGATVPVVLGGGIGASGDRALLAAAAAALAERAPAARLVPTATPPVVGAVALALARARETQL
jgi:N-acetylglucosamine kinase-like BadF-type ATPase